MCRPNVADLAELSRRPANELIARWQVDKSRSEAEARYVLSYLNARRGNGSVTATSAVATASLLAAIGALAVAVYVGWVTVSASLDSMPDSSDISALAQRTTDRLNAALNYIATIGIAGGIIAVALVAVLIVGAASALRAGADAKRIALVQRDLFMCERAGENRPRR